MASIQHNSSGGNNLQFPDSESAASYLRSPDEHLEDGSWECEPFYYSFGSSSSTSTNSTGFHSSSSNGGSGNGRRIKRGKAYRSLETSEYVAFESHRGVVYRAGDCVYLESFQAELPYYVCGIQGFKMTKREQLNVVVKWYYRPSEVPEGVWHTLVQDRHTEHTENGDASAVLGIKNPTIQRRELFISDATDIYSVSALRGKCRLRHFKDIAAAAANFKAETDTFFYILGYNPENNRLASIQGEIRVGPSHQAKLPEFRANAAEWSPSDEECEEGRETLLWMPGMVADSDLMMFLRAARSMAAFAGMCDSGSTDDGCLAAARDATTVNALKVLHEQKYDKTKALQELVKKPVPLSPDQKWSDEDKGECIEFYYLWKKSPMAGNQRPRQRVRRPQTTILRRIRSSATVGNNKPSRPASSEFLDFSSASEKESDSEEVVEKDLPGYACHHCYATTSKDWHHAGKDRALLCTDCRIYFKKYGDLRSVDRPSTPPPYLFKPVKDGEGYFGDYVPGVRTRAGRSSAGKESFAASASFSLIGGRRRPMTPTAEMETSRKSPSAVSTTSTSSSSAAESEPIASLISNGNGIKKTTKRGKKSKRTRKQAAAEARRKRRKTSMEEQTGDEERDRESPESTPSSTSAPSSPKASVDQAMATLPEPEAPPPDPDTNTSQERAAAVFEFSDDPLSESLGQFKRQMEEVTAKASGEGRKLPKLVGDPERQVELLAPTPKAQALSEMPKATTASVIQALQDHVVKEEVVEPEILTEEKENHPEPGEVPAINKEPEPKIDDTIMNPLEGEKRLNSKFRRHWYRGETNSCSRTDLIFMVKEGSGFAKLLEAKKVERHIKHEPRERPDREQRVAQSPKQSSSHTGPPPPVIPPHHPHSASHIHPSASAPNIMTSPTANPNVNPAAAFMAKFGGIPPSNSMVGADLPALQRLRAYAEQAQSMGPGNPAFLQQAMADPHLAHKILLGHYGEAERQRLEMLGAQERQRCMDEQLRRDYELAAKTAMGAAPPTPAPSVPPPTPGPQPTSAAQMDPRYWVEFQQRLAAAAAGVNPPASLPPPAGVDPGAMERMMAEHWLRSEERLLLERQAMHDPVARHQLEKMIQLVANAQHHTHSHTHSHTHLHIHPSGNNPSGSASQAPQPPSFPPMSQAQPPTSVSGAEQAMMQLQAAAAGARPPGLTLPTVDANAVDVRMVMAMQDAARMNHMASLGLPPGTDPLMAERIMQQRQMEMQRQLIERQQLLQHNEMMRRLQQEGTAMANLPGVIRPPHP